MFDLVEFLTAMLKAFLECRQDTAEGSNVTFRAMFDGQPIAVRFAARRALSRQARRLGFRGKARRKFAEENLDLALAELSKEIDSLRAT